MSGIEGIVKVLEARRQDVRLQIALALFEDRESGVLLDRYRAIVDNRDRLMQRPRYGKTPEYSWVG